MTLIGKACRGRDLGQAGASFAHKLDCAPQSQMHDVTVWRYADRPGEHARKVKRTSPGDVCER